MSRWTGSDAPRGDDYDAQWDRLAEAGRSIHGEADLVAALEPRTVLDAGCGTGRVAIELARRGISAVGVDLDPGMLASARRKGPDITWIEADLLDVDVARPEGGGFDVVVAAGNVMIFLAPGTEPAVVANLAGHLRPGGALVAGFQVDAGRLPLEVYDRAAAAAGLELEQRWATWDGQPYTGGEYAVSLHRAVL